MQAKSQGNSDVIDRLDVRCRLVELQQRLVSNLEASSPQVPPLLHSLSTPALISIGLRCRHLCDISQSTPWGCYEK